MSTLDEKTKFTAKNIIGGGLILVSIIWWAATTSAKLDSALVKLDAALANSAATQKTLSEHETRLTVLEAHIKRSP